MKRSDPLIKCKSENSALHRDNCLFVLLVSVHFGPAKIQVVLEQKLHVLIYLSHQTYC